MHFQHSDGEMHRLQPKAQYSPTQNTGGFLLKEIANQDSRNTSSYTDDYVMVPAQFPSKTFEPHSYYVDMWIHRVPICWCYCFYFTPSVGEYTCEVDVGSPLESCLIYSGWVAHKHVWNSNKIIQHKTWHVTLIQKSQQIFLPCLQGLISSWERSWTCRKDTPTLPPPTLALEASEVRETQAGSGDLKVIEDRHWV